MAGGHFVVLGKELFCSILYLLQTSGTDSEIVKPGACARAIMTIMEMKAGP